jgi:septal ring factor EnvC (AmiA/AmiB activator)
LDEGAGSHLAGSSDEASPPAAGAAEGGRGQSWYESQSKAYEQRIGELEESNQLLSDQLKSSNEHLKTTSEQLARTQEMFISLQQRVIQLEQAGRSPAAAPSAQPE